MRALALSLGALLLTAASASAEPFVQFPGVVDPWADARPALPASRAVAVFEPLPEIIDPWAHLPPSVRALATDEIVDPWRDDHPTTIPTAAFPLLE